ncbi:MAG: CPBP family intramembrane glutamic endopeptidase [Candidatus Acidiferrales bacterium]
MFSFSAMHWDFALILLFLGIALPLLGRRRVRQLMQSPSTTKLDRLSLYASTLAFQWLAAGVILWRAAAHGLRPAQLGFSIGNPSLTMIVTVALAALVLINQLISLRRIVARPAEAHGLLPQLALKLFPQDDVERLAFFALVVTVAICEELIYRGFVQRVFQDWSGGALLAGVFGSAIYFAIAHLYQGRRGLASTFVVGLIFAGTRVWTGSLLPPIVAHFAADITVGILAPGRIRPAMIKSSLQGQAN